MQVSTAHISKAQVKYIRSLQQKKIRDAEGVFVAEGDKCIGELMGAFELVMLVQENGNDNANVNANRVMATRTEIEQMSGMRTPQGSIAVFRKASRNTAEQQLNVQSTVKQPELILALDGIQDPGNLGTIIRTCDWFGIRNIYCSRETADCYNPKVVQATMGALARVHIHYVDLVEWLGTIHSQDFPIYGTLLDGKNMYQSGAIEQRERGVIIMGNEGNGISSAVRERITHPLYIPAYGEGVVESLNVSIATAITLAEFRRISQHQ